MYELKVAFSEDDIEFRNVLEGFWDRSYLSLVSLRI